jgi:hypothetical protein
VFVFERESEREERERDREGEISLSYVLFTGCRVSVKGWGGGGGRQGARNNAEQAALLRLYEHASMKALLRRRSRAPRSAQQRCILER